MTELESMNKEEDLLGFKLANTLILSDIDEYKDTDDIANNSLCKIYNNDNNDKYGTGFLCQIPDPENEDENIFVLFTCNHVFPINKDNLNNYKIIKYKKINEKKETIFMFRRWKKSLDTRRNRLNIYRNFSKEKYFFFHQRF